jgi:rubrerythrin
MTVRPVHERMLETLVAEGGRVASRRGLLANSAKLAGGGAFALAALATPGFSRFALAQEDFEDDVDVLNFALTLEQLEATFYRDGLDFFGEEAFGVDPFDESIFERLTEIRDHEEAHVETLTSVIEDLGGEPVSGLRFDFGFTDATTFLATAQTFETTGVSAYDGAAQFLSDQDLLTAAGTIAAVEARHSSYLNLVNGVLPFPAAFENVLTRDEVLEAVMPFIIPADGTGDDDEGTPAT